MNPALTTVIALGVVLVVAWDGFCLRDLIRADPATVRYLNKGTWAIICLLSCPWGGPALRDRRQGRLRQGPQRPRSATGRPVNSTTQEGANRMPG
jgi:hypothetical protein